MAHEITNINNLFPGVNEKLTAAVKFISDNLPAADHDKQIFGKSDSQFKFNTLTLHQLTPHRLIYQILSNIQKIELALKDNYFNIEKKKIEIEEYEASLCTPDPIRKKRYQLEINERKAQISTTEVYISGAIRSLAYFLDQYKSVMVEHRIDSLTEADYEREEIKYHIMTAFNQGITAARSRGGLIDEGNHIYLQQLGISGYDAQRDINALFIEENETNVINKHPILLKFLEDMAAKYTPYYYEYMKHKGLKPISEVALLPGDSNV